MAQGVFSVGSEARFGAQLGGYADPGAPDTPGSGTCRQRRVTLGEWGRGVAPECGTRLTGEVLALVEVPQGVFQTNRGGES